MNDILRVLTTAAKSTGKSVNLPALFKQCEVKDDVLCYFGTDEQLSSLPQDINFDGITDNYSGITPIEGSQIYSGDLFGETNVHSAYNTVFIRDLLDKTAVNKHEVNNDMIKSLAENLSELVKPGGQVIGVFGEYGSGSMAFISFLYEMRNYGFAYDIPTPKVLSSKTSYDYELFFGDGRGINGKHVAESYCIRKKK